jgi:hypothetical protein
VRNAQTDSDPVVTVTIEGIRRHLGVLVSKHRRFLFRKRRCFRLWG